ncbi:MAG: phosphopyruvate hydratase [Patescibacteria group bacterium]|nr:phosphopyruvate hydratase [Patescibacteria group bacterium]MCL5095373.1 phosphopyruvate hydratase [Patescibacteria group bacterium]
MPKIKEIKAREILDSRGNPTIETKITLDNDILGIASVPSGASLGKYEALELRDADMNRYFGLGVLKAVGNVNQVIGPKLLGFDPTKQQEIDRLMIDLDGTENKSKLGANSLLSVSLAVASAASKSQKLPLYRYLNSLYGETLPTTIEKMPTPTFNIINGGKHGAGNLDFQEFHVVPATTKPYHEALRIGEEIYQKLKEVLIHRNAIRSVGDEGGFAPNLFTNLDTLEIILEAVKLTPHVFGRDVFLGLDIAASNFKKADGYQIKDKPNSLSANEFIEYLINLNKEYQLLILEDPLDEDDWEDWARLTQLLGKGTLIVGDDLLATNLLRLKQAIDKRLCTTILIKPNQAGTLSETLEVVKTARAGGFKVIVSHRSGETNDTFIADFAVAVGSDYVKFGAPARGERVAKYNRLLEIEEELNLK